MVCCTVVLRTYDLCLLRCFTDLWTVSGRFICEVRVAVHLLSLRRGLFALNRCCSLNRELHHQTTAALILFVQTENKGVV